MRTRHDTRSDATIHLGEAQCIFIAERDGFVIATNDGRARDRARGGWDERANAPRVPGMKKVDVFHAIEVLYVCIRLGTLDPEAAWLIYERAVTGGFIEAKGFGIPGSKPRFIADAERMAFLATTPRA